MRTATSEDPAEYVTLLAAADAKLALERGYPDDSRRQRALEADAVLLKPVQPVELIALLKLRGRAVPEPPVTACRVGGDG